MSLTAIIFGVAVYHVGAINGLSLITGRYGSVGLLDDNSMLLGKTHLIGVGLAIVAAAVLYWSIRTNHFEIGTVIAGGFMFGDLWCIFKMLRR